MADMNIDIAKARLAESQQTYDTKMAVAQHTYDNVTNAAALVLNQDKIQYIIDEWICNGDDAAMLDLSRNRLTGLPDNLPDNLQNLDCSENQLTELPEHLPNNLRELHCGKNQLTELPDNLPDNLQILCCSDNQLTELPYILPNNLQELDCSVNYLIKLPNIPDTLREMCCRKQQVKIHEIMEHDSILRIREWLKENPREVMIKSANKNQ